MTTALVVWVGSLMVLGAERGAAGAEINTFGEAVWWSFETITTVGYGDFVPVTSMGRFIATLIMLVGISVLGVVSAGVAATLIKQTNVPPAPLPHFGNRRLDYAQHRATCRRFNCRLQQVRPIRGDDQKISDLP
jgi:voltage-gated potassium channel